MSESPQPSPEERISAILSPEPPPEAPAEPAEARGEPAEAVETPEQGDDSPEHVQAADEALTQEAGIVEDEGEAPNSDGEGEVETLEIGTLSELAEHLGVEVSDLYENVTVPVQTPDGRVEVTLGQWKDGWQANEQAAQASKQLAEQRAAFEAEQTQLQEQYQQSLAEAAGLADSLQAAMLAPFERVDWNGLRESDPTEWAAKRQELMEAQQRVHAMRQQVQAKISAFREEGEAKSQQQREQLLRNEWAALIAAVPEFADTERAPAEMAELRTYLKASGFKDEEISQAYDHRLIVMARKARLYDESLKKADVAKKKVVRLAKKTSSPGARQSKQEQQHDQRRAIRAKLKKSGKVEDAAAAIRNLL